MKGIQVGIIRGCFCLLLIMEHALSLVLTIKEKFLFYVVIQTKTHIAPNNIGIKIENKNNLNQETHIT